MDINKAQDDFRAAYILGAPGVFISGAAWLIGSLVWTAKGPGPGFLTLFVGGIFIFPLSMLVSRTIFGAKAADKANPLNALGFEATVPLFAGIFIAYALLGRSPPLAFALLAITVGARYFAFATLYRDRSYWVLGGLLFAIGCGFVMARDAVPVNVALCVGIAELAFSAVLFARWRRAD